MWPFFYLNRYISVTCMTTQSGFELIGYADHRNDNNKLTKTQLFYVRSKLIFIPGVNIHKLYYVAQNKRRYLSKNQTYHSLLSITLQSSFGGLEVAWWPLVSKFEVSHPAKAVGFLGQKNIQHAFLPRGSKAVGRNLGKITGHFSPTVQPSAAGCSRVVTRVETPGSKIWNV
jgi:hypothetical protein